MPERGLRRSRHPGNGRDVFGAGPPFPFVRAADLQTFDRVAGAEAEDANALRSVEFVGGKRDRIEITGVDWLLAEGLDRIAVK